MSKLLPCPLYNGTAEYSVWRTKCEDDSYLKYPVVVCKGCGLTLWGNEHEEYETIEKDEVRSLNQLWNTRTPKERGVKSA